MKITKYVEIHLSQDEWHQALVDSLPKRFNKKWFKTVLNDDDSVTLKQTEPPEGKE